MELNFKESKVIILPAKKEDNSGYVIAKCITDDLANHKRGDLVYGIGLATKYFKKHNLYLTSDEKIEDGDWYIDDTNAIRQSITSDKDYWDRRKDYRKIIATTDKSITIKTENDYNGKLIWNEPLPQIHESFIKEYVKECKAGNIITDVLVEYEVANCANIDVYNQCEGHKHTYKVKIENYTVNIKLKK